MSVLHVHVGKWMSWRSECECESGCGGMRERMMREKVCAIEHTELAVHLQNDFGILWDGNQSKAEKIVRIFRCSLFLISCNARLYYTVRYCVVCCFIAFSAHLNFTRSKCKYEGYDNGRHHHHRHHRHRHHHHCCCVGLRYVSGKIQIIHLRKFDQCTILWPSRNQIQIVYLVVWSFLKCCADDCARHNLDCFLW